jgi:hypothetical protein
MNNNLQFWLNEQDIPPSTSAPDAPIGAPTMDPNMGTGQPNIAPVQNDPNITNIEPKPPVADEKDITKDPVTPDMPEEKGKKPDDFEVWKNTYLRESIKGDTNKLLDFIGQIRDKEGLHPYQKKFIEDNLNIQLIRQNSNVEKASKEIRKLIKEQLDKNNPATSVVSHLHSVLDTVPTLNNIFIKLSGYGGLKGDLHRKYIAALLGAVQVGSGANTEDIVYNERNYSIMLSTRFNARWGDVILGNWSLKKDDPEKYLSEAELKRMQEGSPEERDVLRRRIVMESIAEQFETRAFIINITSDDGTIYTLGWDLAGSLKAAYADGKLIIKTQITSGSETVITEDGKIIPLVDLNIYYVKETGQQTEDGKPETKEIEFITRKDGILFLAAELPTIKEMSTALQGALLKETPYTGNPSDLLKLSRCIYSSHDLLLRSC